MWFVEIVKTENFVKLKILIEVIISTSVEGVFWHVCELVTFSLSMTQSKYLTHHVHIILYQLIWQILTMLLG